MGRLVNYLGIMTGLMVIFYFAGIIDQTVNSTLLNILLGTENFAQSSLALKVILIIEGGFLAGGIIIGLVVKNLDFVASAFVGIFLFNLGWDFLDVVTEVMAVNPVIGTLVLAPLLFIYVITIYDWVRGKD